MQERTWCPGSQEMLRRAEQLQIETVWDRYQAQLPQCGFGELGPCCRFCLQGPCRVDPFGEGPQRGICGADADSIVARNLARAIAAGTAAHSGHAKHLAHTLHRWATGKAPDYGVKDEAKLRAVAGRLGIPLDGKDVRQLAQEVAEIALADFSEKETPVAWVATTVTKGRVERALQYGVVPPPEVRPWDWTPKRRPKLKDETDRHGTNPSRLPVGGASIIGEPCDWSNSPIRQSAQ